MARSRWDLNDLAADGVSGTHNSITRCWPRFTQPATAETQSWKIKAFMRASVAASRIARPGGNDPPRKLAVLARPNTGWRARSAAPEGKEPDPTGRVLEPHQAQEAHGAMLPIMPPSPPVRGL